MARPRESARAASKLIDRIEDKVLRLKLPELALMGRPGLVPGTREIIEAPYIIVYEVREADGEIAILSVVHGARNRTAT
jgi:plasmid stabilization system protein ParE